MEAEDVLNLEYSFNDDKTIFGWTILFNIAVVNTRTLFISQMQLLHSIKVRKTCIWSTNAEERLLRRFLPRMCSGKVLFFTCLQWPCQEKNKSKSHSLRWVTLCSARVFEWQHKDGLSFLNYFCPLLFYCHPNKDRLWNWSFPRHKLHLIWSASTNATFLGGVCRHLTVQRKNASDGSSWCHYWSSQLTWSDYHGLKIPYRFQSFLGILHGSEKSSDNHPHETQTSTNADHWKRSCQPSVVLF